MVIFPILLALVTGLLLLRICNQHHYLNIFEQIAVGFIAVLALFVFELFLQGVVLNSLSLLFPIITFFVLLGIFVYKDIKNKGYIKEVFFSIRNNFIDMGKQFVSLVLRKKYLILGIFIYTLIKVFMIFSINTYMPTFDEDAVAGRDMKTKIFASNKSLVLDKNSPEYFGSDYGRYPFAGIADTYFLLPYGNFVNGLGNIVSPLIYILALFLLFGIFLRKTNIFVAVLSCYIFTSLPFVFIHGFGSYRNLPAGVFLFVFLFYLVDQLFHLEKEYGENRKILLPLLFVGFISSIIRNEGVMITGIFFLTIVILYHIFKKGKRKELVFQLRPLLPIIFGYVIEKIIFSFYPTGTVLNTGGTEINSNLLISFFSNINQSGVFVAPFQQMFYHPDYTLLFLLLFLTLILFLSAYKKMKQIWIMFCITVFIILLFMLILYANAQSLGLLTHFAFIRYPLSIVMFLIYTIVYSLYLYKK